MPIINFSNPFSIFIGVVLFVLVLYLAKENKKAKYKNSYSKK